MLLAAFIAFRKAAIIFELRILRTRGFSNATNRNEGRNMPIVATIAPLMPFTWYPIKVTEENTGPGVNCPTAMASINCWREIMPLATNSESRR